jgi:DNA-directed RNA polymerase specialized sigma24 family protein
MGTGYREDWSGAQSGFQQFLDWLDEGVDSGGETYLAMRRRLVRYFDRKNCLAPDELADETLSRAARRLREEGSITDASPPHFCFIVARYVLLEYQRRPEHRQVSLDALPEFVAGLSHAAPPASPPPESDARSQMALCLERCLQKLASADRDLIFEYYHGERRVKIEHRLQLAARFRLTMNALAIRACRIRQRLEDCVRTYTKV